LQRRYRRFEKLDTRAKKPSAVTDQLTATFFLWIFTLNNNLSGILAHGCVKFLESSPDVVVIHTLLMPRIASR